MTATPIALFVDDGFPHEPFAQALTGCLECRTTVTDDERARVLALVTGSEPIGLAEVGDFPALRGVVTCTVGTDHLDVAGLRARGLRVLNTPGYCTEEVADHALACVLAGWRGLWRLGEDVRAGRWEPSTELRRFDHQRLGIIGLGRIGRALAARALSLAIEVVGHDPVAPAPPGVTPVGLDELLAGCDAVSLHLPGAPGAPPLLDRTRIAAMQPGAVLVNLARPGVLDLDAALEAVREGRLSAALDVWPREPPGDDPRLRTPGLLVTPHVGWSSPQADLAYREEAIAALRSLVHESAPEDGDGTDGTTSRGGRHPGQLRD